MKNKIISSSSKIDPFMIAVEIVITTAIVFAVRFWLFDRTWTDALGGAFIFALFMQLFIIGERRFYRWRAARKASR